MGHTFLTTLFVLMLSLTALHAEKSGDEMAKEGIISYYHENYLEAGKLLTTAAEKGNAEAHYYLGAMYINGQGFPVNYQEAARHFTASAAQNHPGAQLILGVLYIQGIGVPQNFKRAARLLILSGKQNNANAQEILGWVYKNGIGVRQNNTIAYALWNYVAAQGSEWARINRNTILSEMSDEEVYQAQELSLHLQKLWNTVERQNLKALHDEQLLVTHRRLKKS